MALNFALRRVCCHPVKLKSVVSSAPPLQTFSRCSFQYQRPICLCQTVKPICDHHLVLGASVRWRVDNHIFKRNFFTKWSSTSRSSHVKEKLASASEGQEAAKNDAEDRTRDSEMEEMEDDSIIPKTDEKGQPLSNWKRMKIMMKTYGYVIIPVHWVIAPLWFGAFYYTIKLGVDIGPLLKAISVSEHHIEYLQNSKASTALLAYALYKIFTPLRYTVTLAATEVTIRRLRKMGYIRPHPPKEKSYRDSFKETVVEMKDKVKDMRDSRNP